MNEVAATKPRVATRVSLHVNLQVPVVRSDLTIDL